jgi:DNA-binding FadR family transcriptional regulator
VVRETLRVLEAKGMIVARPGIGTWVRSEADWNLLDAEVIGWRLHGASYRHQMRELWELRHSVEPYAARLAADRADNQNRK